MEMCAENVNRDRVKERKAVKNPEMTSQMTRSTFLHPQILLLSLLKGYLHAALNLRGSKWYINCSYSSPENCFSPSVERNAVLLGLFLYHLPRCSMIWLPFRGSLLLSLPLTALQTLIIRFQEGCSK